MDEGVVSSDGRYLLFQRDSTGNGEVWYRALQGDTTARPIAAGGQGAYGARFSPDGKWITYTSTESGVEEVYVRPFPSLERQYRISLAGGSTPVWSPDGRRIYYVNGGQLIAATVGSLSPFTVASRATILSRGFSFGAVHADYDVGRDGTVLAFLSPNEGTQIVVVRNLGAELRARVREGQR